MSNNFKPDQDWEFVQVDHARQTDGISCGVFCLKVRNDILSPFVRCSLNIPLFESFCKL